MEKTYIAIDLKSFYASVECVERGLDPLTANLVVADPSRTEKTICLAVSPSLKSHGIPGRARLFEVVQKVEQVNRERRSRAPGRRLAGKSIYGPELEKDPSLELDYVVAPPRMAKYMEISASIYDIYLKYVSADDIHVYSIDEVFIDATPYLKTYRMDARELAITMIHDVLDATGITATAGIGTNMYLCKIAMDIEAKHIPADADGVRIASLDERSYREKMWDHRPLKDFWRVGYGIAAKLEQYGMYTMGDIALMSLQNEELLYRLFGINAELLIDHAWGYEPCTISEIKGYRPASNSISSGQVLQHPYDFAKAKLVVREMTDLLSLDLVQKHLVTDQIDLTVGYDVENLTDPEKSLKLKGAVKTDWFGRAVPKSAHSSSNLGRYTSSTKLMTAAMMELYDRIVDPDLTVRRMYVVANHVIPEEEASGPSYEQLDFFTDYDALEEQKRIEDEALEKERQLQNAMLDIKKKFGKNAILKGMNLQEGATAIERNGQVGGHKA